MNSAFGPSESNIDFEEFEDSDNDMIPIVRDLQVFTDEFLEKNTELFPGDISFTYVTDGCYDAIKLDEEYLAGDNVEREWDDEKDDYTRTLAQDVIHGLRLRAHALLSIVNAYGGESNV